MIQYIKNIWILVKFFHLQTDLKSFEIILNNIYKGMKPRMKNHFRAHQLSIWLRLIPELHKAGMEDVLARHNLFKNHEDSNMYDGHVKPDSFSRLPIFDENYKRRNNISGEFSVNYYGKMMIIKKLIWKV